MQSHVRLRGRTDPVRVPKVIGLAANYGDRQRPEPIVFLKLPTSIVWEGEAIRPPSAFPELTHEVEIVVLLGEGGRHIAEQDAMRCVAGYAVGLDMNLALLKDLREGGWPWTLAKAWDTSAAVSEFVPASQVADPHAIRFGLRVNGQVRQEASTAEMIWRIPQQIAFLSRIFTLDEGDIIYTGTPAGVDAARPGDRLDAWAEGIGEARWTVEEPR